MDGEEEGQGVGGEDARDCYLSTPSQMKNGLHIRRHSWLQDGRLVPVVETPDQMDTIRDVKRDMEQPRPMDRLVAGMWGMETGCGKAAFKAVAGRSRSRCWCRLPCWHTSTCRLFAEASSLSVEIEVLSRFRSARGAEVGAAGWRKGGGRVFGTHRLLQRTLSSRTWTGWD